MEGNMWNVEIISTDTIKPSSPTPHHLRGFKLSLLDQLSPPTFVLLILYYSPNTASNVHHLKKSLSETLVRFYPLAGRIKEDDTIDCNDEGVEFSVARVHGQLSDLLKQSEVEVLNQLIPCDTYRTRSSKDVLLTIQSNIFDCGGMAIGVGILHKIADAATLGTFLNSWSATTCGSSEAIIGPSFDSVSFFPPKKVSRAVLSLVKPEEKIVTKRFLFLKSSIAALKIQANGTDPSSMGFA
ncbi:stemmadenine O-acetyltransferase-like [Tasmannia lanceolata]|uniref:stemmadenine O-acetyltransferase-like n=1 Tax=Tasmannia lanceolata TaxID=3420 RepID=UPI004063B3E0